MSAGAAPPPLTYTLDLERHRPDAGRRWSDNAMRLLDFFAARGVRVTVFVVGELVDDAADLLARAHADGHELALHSHAHTALTAEDRERYASRLGACVARLADLTGAPVAGFRAPVFSLTPGSRWVPEVLGGLGFRYSSSVLPAAHPLFGWAGAPATPFRWPGGLLELPVPVTTVLGQPLPFLGGIYLRYLPACAIAGWRRALPHDAVPWSYVHPYDIDTAESYYRFPGTSHAQSWLLWRRRGATLSRLAGLMQDSAGLPAAEPFATRVARGEFDAAPTFAPV